MAQHQLLLSFDLHDPYRNYDQVVKAIQGLGASVTRIHYACFHALADLTPAEACRAVWAQMDPRDSLFVVDTCGGTAAWENLEGPVPARLEAASPRRIARPLTELAAE